VNGEGTDPDILGYANLLLAVIQDDIRHVHARVTAAVAVAAVFVTQIELMELRDLSGWFRWLTGAGVLCLVLSAASYFHYTQKLNRTRLRIAAELPALTSAEAWKEQFFPPPTPWYTGDGRWYSLGQSLLLVGSTLVTVVLGRLLSLW